jgi:hypothetical protein
MKIMFMNQFELYVVKSHTSKCVMDCGRHKSWPTLNHVYNRMMASASDETDKKMARSATQELEFN